MDVQIDNKKMWEAFLKYLADNHWGAIPNQFREVLKKQNLEFVGGKIVSIEPEPFIKEGKWYMCLHSSKGFVKGRCYKATKDGSIEGDNAYMYVGNDPTDFRPATECEILKAKFDSPELPEIVKEQVREITEKPTVSWDSVNGTLRFYNLTKEQEEKLKSALIGEPKQELTEFDSIQKIIHDLLSSTNGEWLEEDYMTEMSKNISEDIRKQIVQEIDTEKNRVKKDN